MWLCLVFEIIHRLQVRLLRREILVFSALELYFSQKLNNCLDCSEAHFGLCDVCTIQAVNTVGAEHTSLVLEDAPLVMSFRHVETELVLNVADFVDEVVQSMEVIATCLCMEIKPNVLDILHDLTAFFVLDGRLFGVKVAAAPLGTGFAVFGLSLDVFEHLDQSAHEFLLVGFVLFDQIYHEYFFVI